MAKEELDLEGWFPLMVPYTLKDNVGAVVSCVTLRFYIRKGRYVGHLQKDIISKSPTSWGNLYGAVVLVMGDAIFEKGW